MSGNVKKKIKPGLIESSLEEMAIIVNYDVEEIETFESGETKSRGKERAKKKIKVKALHEGTDVAALAQEIVEKCKLIHSSKVGQVESMLDDLRQQMLEAEAAKEIEQKKTLKKQLTQKEKSRYDDEDKQQLKDRGASMIDRAQYQAQKVEPAYIEELDDYIEKLYEDGAEAKVKATAQIAQLFRNADDLEELLSHQALLGALARVLREDGKRSIDLCTNIISVFFSLSNFSQFHPLIMEQQMGALTMDIIDLEVKRSEHRAEQDGISPDMVAQRAMESRMGKVKLSDHERKLLGLVQKQDRLLYMSFYMLLNLAEDVTVERKMKKKNVTVYLVKMLDRANVELLILVMTFLKKLSIYKENTDKMAECCAVEKLVRFMSVKNDVLLMAVLRLLHNLSFEVKCRDDMVKAGIIPVAVDLMRDQRFQPVIMGLLYHVSMEDKYKSMFTYTDAIPMILEMLLGVEDLRQTPELIALAVNLTQNQRNAMVMSENGKIDKLMHRAMETCDELIFKVARNISQHDLAIKKMFQPYMEPLVELLKAPNINSDLFVEVLGTLANLHITEFNFEALVQKHDLLNFISEFAQPGIVEDDILLEIVIFVGTLCNEGTAAKIVKSGLVTKLYHLMSEKKEDDEFVLQIAYTFQKLLMFPATKEELLNSTSVVFYLVDLLQDNNKEVRRTASKALDVVQDTSEEWATKLRAIKFETHNQEWLEVVDSMAGGNQQPNYRQYAGEENDFSEDDIDYDATVGIGRGNVMDFDEYASAGGWAYDQKEEQMYEQQYDQGGYDEAMMQQYMYQ
mmetsp:Transcript_8017/g.22989  ORF Transcript_8017/g.22989 Transcript_8017/m.22989 type:complete len:794 (-) Transcript_8017:446-2827(-)|eukprot:CAMPEP_0117665570 /NCGR_PEP_ID=MMETSP0804-20121206/9887_1 /TAXON_ID=1074897 /ORGANISM="Tetraselmis astigmatica, Strain CCMP880" /LENGTH=793 /DNA_ID=CAMNT_0005473005 /DNA_START=120 /DNA_END=2501 /DNA_ORIENTATION=-